jgi:porphobilinogen synthase
MVSHTMCAPQRSLRAAIRARAWPSGAPLSATRLVQPLFVQEPEGRTPISAMPGCVRLGPSALLDEVDELVRLGICTVVLFPMLPASRKDPIGSGACDADGLIPSTVRRLRECFPTLLVMTDVALDPYNSDGHDGIVGASGAILNDETVEALCRQALVQAEAGAQIVAPSDMMDGRVGAIRETLDAHGHQEVAIVSYTAKYAASWYGPFREALDSAPRFGDKRTYQMDPANARERPRSASGARARRGGGGGHGDGQTGRPVS